jgi:hypothetical protein
MERHDKANTLAFQICITNEPKMNFKALVCDDVEWMNLAEDSY